MKRNPQMSARTVVTAFALSAALVAAFAAQTASAQNTSSKPNIVFILVDNVGWGDFGVYGGTTATPRIDKLANEGIRFNNYNVEIQCTQSRSAIMTGRHPIRSGTWSVVPPAGGKFGLTPWEYTIAKLLSDAGYATALYGKWHLGNTQGRLPNDQGFDEWWGIPDSWDEAAYTTYPLFNAMVKKVLAEKKVPELLDLPPHILEGRKGEPSKIAMPLDMKVRPIVDGQYLIPKTIDFIKRQAAAKKPFFVYLGYSEMHPPEVCNPDFVGKSPLRGGMYADCIAEMDYRVGQILDAIKEAGIDDNTIVVLSSDNGPVTGAAGSSGGSTGPYRGNIYWAPFEGSMRVPAMVRWPGKVPAGIVTEQMLAAVDWLPTLAGFAGASNLVPKDRPIDGKDASAFMLGRSPTTGRDYYMFFGSDGRLMSVKWMYYKMVLRYNRGPGPEAINHGFEEPILPQFFDLSSDPHEDYNLWNATLTMGWAYFPMLEIMGAYEKSVREYPNIMPGEEDFKGYPRR
ncbi:MAG TPA: arylsulfatase [Burkholderiales bacterium]|nr:arylsulfatase [Burkholderiales bacterium]